MRTKLLYLDDDHLMSFEATVVAVDPEARTLVLDRTAFYPTGGHQHCDQGRLGKGRRDFVIVTDVKQSEDGVVMHHWSGGEGTLEVGDVVQGSVHEERRLHHMALHSAQHALSRFAADRFGTQTGRADFSPKGGLAVMEPPLTWKEMLLLEDDVNRLIRAARPVTRSVDDEGRNRIAIEELDESPCAGTHVTSTAEIGLFKVTALEGKVVRYEVGSAAARFAIRGADTAQELARRLEVERLRELPDAVEALIAERDQALARLEQWKAETSARSIAAARRSMSQCANGTGVLRVDFTHLTGAQARELLKGELARDGEVWITLADRGNLMVASGSSYVNARDVVRAFVERWGIRGGGNARFAQGGPVPADTASPLDQVVEHVLRGTARVAS